jgi:ligand-binding sensor domain-containing protein/signal transduction histidine kinase/DNA-binding response OmpR family regulator
MHSSILNKRFFSLLLFCCIANILSGQSYYFRNYQVSNGVSSNTITCITQDKKGFMWFGTRNGLNRFDGTIFKVFRNDADDPQSIGSNSILSLYEDSKERLWVGTYKGIYIYDAVHEKFDLFKNIPQAEIRYIRGDDKKNVWVIGGSVLYKFNIESDALTVYKLDNSPLLALSNNDKGDIWIASSNGLIRNYNPEKKISSDYNINKLYKSNAPVFIQAMYPVNDSTLLITTLQQALLFNTRSLHFTNIFKGRAEANNIQVHKIIHQSANEYWLGTENGLYIVNLTTKNIQLIRKQYTNPYSIDDNVITDFCKDKEGNTWVGTFFGGINYYSKELNQFQKYFPLPGSNSISGNLVHEICVDKNNNLWIGTEDAGLNKLDTKTGIFTHFKPGKQKGNIAYQNVHGLLADGNELWIGTYEHGLDVMNLKTQKVIRHYEKSAKPNSLSSNFIVTVYKTKEGKILIGTWNGLFRYNKSEDNFTLLPYFNRQAQSILEDENGTLWVCSYGNGVYYCNEKSGLKGRFVYNADNPNSLPNNYVNNIFEDSKKNIWFCTESGLCMYDASLKKIIRRVRQPILRNNQVFKILEDSKGILWVSTSQGLVSLDMTTNQTKIYNTNNGLLSEQFNYNSAFKSSDGTLYFGTVKGMIAFNPSAITKDKYVPPVYITNIQINNVTPKIGIPGSRLQQSVLSASSIHLPYDSSTVTIDVASLSYTMPALNEYKYKMDGLDKEWSPVQNNHKIYYTKLSPGDYTFKIKGSNGDGVWNNKEAILNIDVSPPYWASTGAYILYVLFTLSVAFVIIKYYTLALREKNKREIKTLEIEKEREVYNAKIEFFTNITHEIRTPLTLIKLPLEKLLKNFPKGATLHENLTMIEKNTNRLIYLTNQLLDFRKAEANNYMLNFVKTDVNDLLKELFATYKPVAEEKKISFKLEMPRITLLAYVDSEAIRKILSNLFSNALKYAEKCVVIKLLPFNSDDNVFHIEFKNDGYIIPNEMKEKIFEPFYRIKHTEKFAGTGIGLPLARSLTELHKGKLELTQHTDTYNIFLLSIPFHQETEINFNDYETIATAHGAEKQEENITQNLHTESILIVDDNDEIVDFLQKELQNTYNIYTASDGQQAFDVLKAENINIVISDIMMPVMDGIGLCMRIKTDVQYCHIPVILLTAKNTLQSKIMGLENGADAYIEKPFVMEHLLAQIKSLLVNREHTQHFYAHSPLAHIKGIACTKADKDFLERLQMAIEENITDMDLNVDTLAKMMNMSRGSFYRKIKGLSDLTPNELINVSRLKKAAGLLAEGNYRITEVAGMVGYHLSSNFSRDFNKQFGISPSNYLNNLRNV